MTGTDKDGEVEQARARAGRLEQHGADGHESAEQRQTRVQGYARSGEQRATQARILADEGNALPLAYAPAPDSAADPDPLADRTSHLRTCRRSCSVNRAAPGWAPMSDNEWRVLFPA